MENSYQIISDSSCDLTLEIAEKNNIMIVPFYVSFDEVNYKREIEDIKVRDFYQQMVDNPKVFPKSSLPSIQDYVDAFELYAKENIPIICICITTKFSGSYQSANNAKDIILEQYPDEKIQVIDATVNTVLQGLYVLEAVRMRDNGLSYDDTISNLERIKSTGRIFFTIGNLDYLQHGGRIGKLMGIAGNILGIRPIITLKEGEIFPSGISRGRYKSLTRVIDILIDYLKEQNANINDYSITVGYGYDYEEAVKFKDNAIKILKQNGYNIDDINIAQIGATIGVHTGPYPLGFGIIKKYDC